MKAEDFAPNAPGALVPIVGGHRAFVPHDLPPVLAYDVPMINANARAQAGVARVEQFLSRSGIEARLLTTPLMRREAVFSSRIEGTYTTPTQMALFEALASADAPGDRATPPRDESREVLSHLNAMDETIKVMRRENLPICARLLKVAHEALMRTSEGGGARPGEFRRTQNYIGHRRDGIAGARFVPPPPEVVPDGMDRLCRFMSERIGVESDPPPLIGIALAHYQFETIHPFEDGNGRIGRFLVPLGLMSARLLEQPLLYVSAWLDKTRQDYVDLMLSVSQKADWRAWVLFFLEAVAGSADDAIRFCGRLVDMRTDYLERVTKPRSSAMLRTIVNELFRSPVMTIKMAAELTNVTVAQAGSYLRRLVEVNILREVRAEPRKTFLASEITDLVFATQP